MSDSRNHNNAKLIKTNIDVKFRQTSHNSLFRLPADVFQHGIKSYLDDQSLARFSRSCTYLFKLYESSLHDRALQKLLQAIVDNDIKTVTRILDADPYLLSAVPSPHLVIESKLTWQRFQAESAWQMAGKRKQAGMVALLRSYVDKLDATGQAAVLAQWQAPDVKNPEEKTQLDAKNKALREKYDKFLQPLVAVIAREACVNGYTGPFSEETEKALAEFRKNTLPDAAVKLDDYYDINQLLIAAYESYDTNFNVFPEWDQRSVFRINIHGWIQSLVQPELGQIFCESLYEVVEYNQAVSKLAGNYIMKDGVRFYRPSRDSLDGMGGKFLCDEFLGENCYAGCWASSTWASPGTGLQDYDNQTTQNLANSCSLCIVPSRIVHVGNVIMAMPGFWI